MNKVDRNKALSVMESYDEKLRKAQEELQKISDKKDNFFMITIANTLKSNNISLSLFFDYIDVITEDLKGKSKKTDNKLKEMDKAIEENSEKTENQTDTFLE
jgi:hypothetical protein